MLITTLIYIKCNSNSNPIKTPVRIINWIIISMFLIISILNKTIALIRLMLCFLSKFKIPLNRIWCLYQAISKLLEFKSLLQKSIQIYIKMVTRGIWIIYHLPIKSNKMQNNMPNIDTLRSILDYRPIYDSWFFRYSSTRNWKIINLMHFIFIHNLLCIIMKYFLLIC